MAMDSMASDSWQSWPVFITSTFRDMQAERDHLRHVVFPRLDAVLRPARFQLEPIDLRQGIETIELESEDARERLVLKVCLDEIRRSRPFLIVLLGDRYGWIPPEERMVAAAEEAGFPTEVRGKSVTAMEVEFGILQESPGQRRRSFFYFRDRLPCEQMPPAVAAVFSDQHSPDPETRESHRRLVMLKEVIAADPDLAQRVSRYQADWNPATHRVTGLEAWGEMVFQHLMRELHDEIQAAVNQMPLTWQERERVVLAEFVEHRRRDFTGRVQLLEELHALATSPASEAPTMTAGSAWGACLTGAAGSGKSALFAELVARLSNEDSVLLLMNAAGATPRGSQVGSMLERFLGELSDALGIENPVSERAGPDEIDSAFASLLARVAAKRRVVVLLDALDQFDPTPRSQHLTWLRPRQSPGNARLIAMALDGDAAEALSQWVGIEEIEVPPLTVADEDTDDVAVIADSVWRRYHRQPNPAVLRVLKAKRLPDGTFAAGKAAMTTGWVKGDATSASASSSVWRSRGPRVQPIGPEPG